MDKYQEALDRIASWRHRFPETKLVKQKLDNSFNSLQELIDNYSKLEKELNDYRNVGALYIDDNGETSIKLYDKNYNLGSSLNRNAIPKIDLESEK